MPAHTETTAAEALADGRLLEHAIDVLVAGDESELARGQALTALAIALGIDTSGDQPPGSMLEEAEAMLESDEYGRVRQELHEAVTASP